VGGLLIQRRPVDENLEGWQIWKGYMWPYVLAAYFLVNPVVGWVFHPEAHRVSRRTERLT
jgi:hypothetical protein